MTTMEKLCGIILKFKAGKIAPESLQPEALLVENLKLDSLDMAELLVLVEDAFGLEIAPEEARQKKSLQEVAAYLDQRLAG